MARQKAHLDSWRLEPAPHTRGSYWLWGNVYNHPKGFADGSLVHTSLILSINFAERTAETINTDYTLGSPYMSGEPIEIPAKEMKDGEA